LYIAVAFDHPQKTFRHADFVEYKANRVEMPDDLKPQIEIIKEVVETFNIPRFELGGYEADDLIGTLAAQMVGLNAQTDDEIMTLIVTGDRDSFQLVNEYTHVWMPGGSRGKDDLEYDRDGVKLRMGVYPEQIVDLKALMGDASDNIPGVAGVGEKTATKLIQAYETLANVYTAAEAGQADKEKGLTPKVIEKLIADKANALMSQKLAQIDQAVPVLLDLEACKVSSYDKEKAQALLEELDFKSLIPLMPADEFELDVQAALF
jgi:DNA polymerase-1